MGHESFGSKKIEQILIKNKLVFTSKLKIALKNDSKKYRVPDFYLAEYQLAIEYFSSWEVPQNLAMQKRERARFIEKIDAYSANDISCVFIYPNEINAVEEIIMGAIKAIVARQKPIAWVLPWLYMDKIEPPRASDFSNKEEPLNWVLPWLDEKSIEAPRWEDFVERREPLNWNIPWLNEKKIDEPLASDFEDEKILLDSEEPDFVSAPKEFEEEVEQKEEKIVPIFGFILIVIIVLVILSFVFAFLFGI